MNRKAICDRAFLIVLAVALVPMYAPGQPGQAQQNCISFHAIIQAELFPENPVREGDVWGGTVYAYLGQQVLVGRYSGNSGETSSQGRSNIGTGGSDAFDFDNGNTFTAYAAHDTFPTPPGITPFGGRYQAADKVVAGTGIFQNASGKVTVSGPFILWDLDQPLPRGRWNGEVNGNICGVQ